MFDDAFAIARGPPGCCGVRAIRYRIEYTLDPFAEGTRLRADDQIRIGNAAAGTVEIAGVDQASRGGQLLALIFMGARVPFGDQENIGAPVGNGVEAIDRIVADHYAFVVGPDIELAIGVPACRNCQSINSESLVRASGYFAHWAPAGPILCAYAHTHIHIHTLHNGELHILIVKASGGPTRLLCELVPRAHRRRRRRAAGKIRKSDISLSNQEERSEDSNGGVPRSRRKSIKFQNQMGGSERGSKPRRQIWKESIKWRNQMGGSERGLESGI